MTNTGPADCVDLGRYPIDDLSGEGVRALLAEGQAALAARGSFVLSGFLKPEAVGAILAEHASRYGEAYYCRKDHNVFLAPQDGERPADHPFNRLQVSDLGCLAWDQIGGESLLGRLYDWPPLGAFLAALLGYPRLYPYEDPLGSVNLNLFQPGQQLGWHYDNADFAITLMLQPAATGGVYEYLPAFRDREDPEGEGLAAVLGGEREGVLELTQGSGALVLFRGRRSLHRVTPVVGERPRIVVVFSYDPEPGRRLTAHTQELFYGRSA